MNDFLGKPITLNLEVLFIDRDSFCRGYVKHLLDKKVMIEPRDLAEWIAVNPEQLIIL